MSPQPPVIDSITITPATLVEGGTATVVVKAHDPNARAVTITAIVTVDGVSAQLPPASVTVGASPVVISGWSVNDPEGIATITANADGTATLKV